MSALLTQEDGDQDRAPRLCQASLKCARARACVGGVFLPPLRSPTCPLQDSAHSPTHFVTTALGVPGTPASVPSTWGLSPPCTAASSQPGVLLKCPLLRRSSLTPGIFCWLLFSFVLCPLHWTEFCRNLTHPSCSLLQPQPQARANLLSTQWSTSHPTAVVFTFPQDPVTALGHPFPHLGPIPMGVAMPINSASGKPRTVCGPAEGDCLDEG